MADPIDPTALGLFVLDRLDDWQRNAREDPTSQTQIAALRLQAGLLISAAHMPDRHASEPGRTLGRLALQCQAMLWATHPDYRREWTLTTG